MKLELEVTEEEVEFLDDLVTGSMEDGIPMDKLDQYNEGMYIDPAESLLEKLMIWKKIRKE